MLLNMHTQTGKYKLDKVIVQIYAQVHISLPLLVSLQKFYFSDLGAHNQWNIKMAHTAAYLNADFF